MLLDGKAPAVVVEAAPPSASADVKDAAIPLHPVVSLFVRDHVIAGLVEKGMPRAKARKIVSERLSDEFLKAGLEDAGVKLPAAPPAGGWIAVIIAALPQIMALITQLIALFGG